MSLVECGALYRREGQGWGPVQGNVVSLFTECYDWKHYLLVPPFPCGVATLVYWPAEHLLFNRWLFFLKESCPGIQHFLTSKITVDLFSGQLRHLDNICLFVMSVGKCLCLMRRWISSIWVFPFKVHSYGAAAAKAFLPQWSQSVNTVRQQQWQSSMQCNAKYFATATATQNGVGTYLVVLPLPQSLLLPLSVIKSIWYCGIQLLQHKNVAIAAAAATLCERTFTPCRKSTRFWLVREWFCNEWFSMKTLFTLYKFGQKVLTNFEEKKS